MGKSIRPVGQVDGDPGLAQPEQTRQAYRQLVTMASRVSSPGSLHSSTIRASWSWCWPRRSSFAMWLLRGRASAGIVQANELGWSPIPVKSRGKLVQR
jgi:hypothetical protein